MPGRHARPAPGIGGMPGRHRRRALAEQGAEAAAQQALLAHAADLLHHVGHLPVHLEEPVQLLHLEAGAGGDALLAAGLQEVGVAALALGHRVDQRDLAAEHPVVEAGLVHLLLHLAHAGQHAHDALHAAHLLHLLELRLQVVHVELTLLEALHHPLGGLGLERLLRLLDQRDDVAHAEDAARHLLGAELLEGVELLADADEADRLAGDGAHRERGAAAAVAVHAGEDDAGEADAAVELLGDVDGVLAGQAVDDEQGLVRAGGVADGGDLGHQLVVDVQAAGGVEHDDVVAAEGGLLLGAFGDRDGVLAGDDRQGVDADLGAEDRELLHRRRAAGVERGHEHALALALLPAAGELGGGRGLARALQADHQHRGGGRVDLEGGGGGVAGEDVDELVVDDLDDLLAGGDRLGDGLAAGLVVDSLDEIAGDRERDVGLEQGDADLAQRGRDVLVGERALAGELVEDAGEPAAEGLEHGRAPLR